MLKPDFGNYSIKELKEALSGVDGDKYPVHLKEITELLKKRRQEFPTDESFSIYAGFGPRLLAYLVDSFFLFVLSLIAYLLVHGFNPPVVGYDQNPIYGMTKNFLIFLYFVGYWAIDGKTPGKSLLGLKIINEKTNLHPGLARSALRFFGYLLSSIPLFLGFLWSIWHPQNKTWHDMLSGTIVVWESRYTRDGNEKT